MNAFETDTRLTPEGPADAQGRWRFAGRVDPGWNIGANPNGGYLLALAARALSMSVPAHPDPLSLTVHYLRPGLPGADCRIETELLRSGRTLSTLRATLQQDGQARLQVLAAMGNLGERGGPGEAAGAGAPADAAAPGAAAPRISLPPPQLPPPEACTSRSGHAQGVELPILDRLEVRLHPDEARPGGVGAARVSGWIRLADGSPPDGLSSLLMADAFPPAVFGLLGLVGWVPTIELTVHLRCRPAPGWLRARFHCEDLAADGRLIEDGALWDAEGRLVVQARQLALMRSA